MRKIEESPAKNFQLPIETERLYIMVQRNTEYPSKGAVLENIYWGSQIIRSMEVQKNDKIIILMFN